MAVKLILRWAVALLMLAANRYGLELALAYGGASMAIFGAVTIPANVWLLWQAAIGTLES